MDTQVAFQATRKFWDDTHFPYGFSRSGIFNCEQAALLEAHGLTYSALATGQRKPSNKLEREFVSFCKGKKEAESIHERTWERYVKKLGEKGLQSFYLGIGDVSEDINNVAHIDDLDD